MSVYIIVRTHGLNTKLLTREFFDAASSVKSIRDLVNMLSPTPYNKYIEKGEKIDIRDLEEAYVKVLADRLNLLYTIPLGKELSEFRDSIIHKFDVENLIKLLLGLKANKSFEEIEEYLIPIRKSKVDYRKMYQERTVDRALQYIRSKGVKVSDRALELFAKYDSILPVEKDLMANHYRSLISAAEKIGGVTKALTKRIIGFECDIHNTFSATASYLYGYSAELTEFLIYPFSGKVDTKTFVSLASSRNPREMIEKLSPYRDVVEYILSKNEFMARIASLKHLARFLSSFKVESFMDPAFLLYIVKKMEYEYKYLIYISYSIYYGVKPELDKEMIIT